MRKARIIKWLIVIFVVLIIPLAVIVGIEEKHYGPAYVKVETYDEHHLDDVVLRYGASYSVLHGERPAYDASQIAVTGKTTKFNAHKTEHFPSSFYISICHPMYECTARKIRVKLDLDFLYSEIDFGVITLKSWVDILNDTKHSTTLLRTIFNRHITDVGNKYIPIVNKYNIKIDKNKYIESLTTFCRNVYETKKAVKMCDRSSFERLFAGVR